MNQMSITNVRAQARAVFPNGGCIAAIELASQSAASVYFSSAESLPSPPSAGPLSPEKIKAKIAQAGTSQAAIAKHLGVRAASVGKVIKGEMRSKRIEAELQKITGQPVNPRPCRALGRPKTVWSGKVMQVAA
jgi:hypothetical protein